MSVAVNERVAPPGREKLLRCCCMYVSLCVRPPKHPFRKVIQPNHDLWLMVTCRRFRFVIEAEMNDPYVELKEDVENSRRHCHVGIAHSTVTALFYFLFFYISLSDEKLAAIVLDTEVVLAE